MQPLWRFINTGAGAAASNMALDEALLLLHEAHTAPPTLRVYGWCQPTLSLGYAQNARQEVDLAACQAQGVAVVRRDRKSTRLNSSHGYISYAVFCLKKKKKNSRPTF